MASNVALKIARNEKVLRHIQYAAQDKVDLGLSKWVDLFTILCYNKIKKFGKSDFVEICDAWLRMVCV